MTNYELTTYHGELLAATSPDLPAEVRITTESGRDLRRARKAIRESGHWVATESEPMYHIRCTVHAARQFGFIFHGNTVGSIAKYMGDV